LASHGWLYLANDTGYDRGLPEDLFAWLQEPHQAAYEKALKAAGSQAKVPRRAGHRSISLLNMVA
jgi:type I restriction enzyme R subunit